VAAGGYDPETVLRLWDVQTGREAQTLPQPAPSFTIGLGFDRRGTKLAAGRVGQPIAIWNLDDVGLPESLPLPKDADNALALSYSPDGTMLAVSYTGRDFARSPIWLYDAVAGTPLRSFSVLHHRVGTLAFSPNSQMLVTGGMHDGSVRLWSTVSGRLLATLQLGSPFGTVRQARFLANDQLAVLHGDGVIRLVKCSRTN
jgi:WD40 repeat protein